MCTPTTGLTIFFLICSDHAHLGLCPQGHSPPSARPGCGLLHLLPLFPGGPQAHFGLPQPQSCGASTAPDTAQQETSSINVLKAAHVSLRVTHCRRWPEGFSLRPPKVLQRFQPWAPHHLSLVSILGPGSSSPGNLPVLCHPATRPVTHVFVLCSTKPLQAGVPGGRAWKFPVHRGQRHCLLQLLTERQGCGVPAGQESHPGRL